MSNHFFDVTNPAAREMMEWRDQCDSTILVGTQILSRGQPKLGDELAEVSQTVLVGKMTPTAAAERLEQGLQRWYAPHQTRKAKVQPCQCVEPISPTTSLNTLPVVDIAPVVQSDPAPQRRPQYCRNKLSTQCVQTI